MIIHLPLSRARSIHSRYIEQIDLNNYSKSKSTIQSVSNLPNLSNPLSMQNLLSDRVQSNWLSNCTHDSIVQLSNSIHLIFIPGTWSHLVYDQCGSDACISISVNHAWSSPIRNRFESVLVVCNLIRYECMIQLFAY